MNGYKFFTNKSCEFYPCHEGIDGDMINCLFCFCPLYALGDRCGGIFLYTDNGIKDCSSCTLPHIPGGYEYIVSKCAEIVEMVKKSTDEKKGLWEDEE